MNCQDYEEQLGDYVEGTLDATTRARVGAHLQVCVHCSATVGDFGVIRAMARELEAVAPSPQVWQALAARAPHAASPFHRARGWLGGWQPVFAAAMAVLLATSLWWVGGHLSAVTVLRPATTAQVFEAESESVEAQYTAAIARLEEVTSVEGTALDPETVDVINAGLMVVDEAIGESRAALETQPENELAQESLFAALRRKIAVLQEMFALINAMRHGNQDAAAQILSELNQ
jgi:anti-sigma factor RsiW